MESKNEILLLANKFANQLGFLNLEALYSTTKALEELHREQNCMHCLQEDQCTNEITTRNPEKDSDDGGDDDAEFHISIEAYRSFRKSVRKSRKSVCILPNYLSSSESNESDSEEEINNTNEDLVDDSLVFELKKKNTRSKVISSEEEEEEDLKKSVTFTPQFIKNGQEKMNFTHEDLIDDSPVFNCKKRNARLKVISSDEEEQEAKEEGVEEDIRFFTECGKHEQKKVNITNENYSVDDKIVADCKKKSTLSAVISNNKEGSTDLTSDKTESINDIEFSQYHWKKQYIIISDDDDAESYKHVLNQTSVITNNVRTKQSVDNSNNEQSTHKIDNNIIVGMNNASCTTLDNVIGQTTHELCTSASNQMEESQTDMPLRSDVEELCKIKSLTITSDNETGESFYDIENDKDDLTNSILQDSIKRKISYDFSDDELPINSLNSKERETNVKIATRKSKNESSVFLSSDDDNFDDFLLSIPKGKKDVQVTENKDNDSDTFIVSDSELDLVEDNFDKPYDLKHNKTTVSSGIEEDEVKMSLQTEVTSLKKAFFGPNTFSHLQTPRSEQGTPAYKREFNRLKNNSVKEYFKIFNKTVFDNKLPSDLKITWNPRLRKTAGYCYYSSSMGKRQSRIELSDKVIDRVDRLRDTLIHELCHAANWLIDGKKAGHGPDWKYWARKANRVHSVLPIITTCHNYSIETKYKYRCNGCSHVFGRHSKSIDSSKHRCGQCGGVPELINDIEKTPKTPNAYTTFVKNNFSVLKKSNSHLGHKELMQLVSQKFKEFKLNESDKENNSPC